MLALQVQATGQEGEEARWGDVCYRVATCHPADDGQMGWTLRPAVLATREGAETLGLAIMRGGATNAVILEQRDGQVWHPAWLRLQEAVGGR